MKLSKLTDLIKKGDRKDNLKLVAHTAAGTAAAGFAVSNALSGDILSASVLGGTSLYSFGNALENLNDRRDANEELIEIEENIAEAERLLAYYHKDASKCAADLMELKTKRNTLRAELAEKKEDERAI